MVNRITAGRLASLVGELPQARPLYEELATALRHAIADGRVPTGTTMPSERELAPALGVSRTTITAAYGALKAANYLRARRGSGTVATLPVERRHRGVGALFPAQARQDTLDLSCAATAAPPEVVSAYVKAVEQLPAWLEGPGYLTLGVPELREQVASWFTDRGADTSADQILITSGAVSALRLVTAAFMRPGTKVAVETASYLNTLDLLRRGSGRLVPLPVDDGGWLIGEAESYLASARPEFALLIPDFHNPTGALMSSEDRERLAAACARAGTVPIIDETIVGVDLDCSTPMPPPMAAFAPDSITVGSASKSHWGGLRVGWVRLPKARLDSAVRARSTQDMGASIVCQLALSEMLAALGFGLAESKRTELRASRAAAEQALTSLLPDVSWVHPRGGLSLWLRLPADVTADDVVTECDAAGLITASGSRFAAFGGLGSRLRLPFVISPDQMHIAVARLASGIQAVRAATAPRTQRVLRNIA